MTKSGFIAITGRPNTGKSTLLNALMGEKIAIVSYKPQTTRSRITGILTEGDCQFVFTDTPGIHKPKTKMSEKMTACAENTVSDCDISLLVAEPRMPGDTEKAIINNFKKGKVRAILIINKTDTVKKAELLPVIAEYTKLYDFLEVVPVSALKKDNIKTLKEILRGYLTEGPFYYPEDMKTDTDKPNYICELVREKMLKLIDEEIPHGVAVSTVTYEETDGLIKCAVNIYCEKESHKKIIIGKNGSLIKKIGTYAREELERKYGKKVFLDLWIKVTPDWRNNSSRIKSFGIGDF